MATKYIVNNVTGQTINGQSFVPKYKVYTALLTQSGVSNVVPNYGNDPDPLTIGVTYEIVDNTDADFTNVGAPNNNVGTFFVAIGTTPASWGDSVIQYNTGAPVVTVLENTIGNIWFHKNGSEGSYSIESDNLFSVDKTWCSITSAGNQTSIANGYTESIYVNTADDNINIFTGIILDGGVDDVLNNTPIEIRVYN
jgi:hypothetical protein